MKKRIYNAKGQMLSPKVDDLEKELIPKRGSGRPRKGEEFFDLGKAVELRLRGLSFVQIGDLLGCGQTTVQFHLKKLRDLFESEPGVIELYEKNRTNFLKRLQLAVGTAALDINKLKKAQINQLGFAFKAFYDCERLESGKSTQNILTYAEIVSTRERFQKELDELESKSKK